MEWTKWTSTGPAPALLCRRQRPPPPGSVACAPAPVSALGTRGAWRLVIQRPLMPNLDASQVFAVRSVDTARGLRPTLHGHISMRARSRMRNDAGASC